MNVSKELIAKYHQGLCSDQEKALVEAWLDADSEEELSASLEIEQKKSIKEAIWSSLKADTIEKPKKTLLGSSNTVRFRRVYWGAAAVLSVAFLFFWLLRDDLMMPEKGMSSHGSLSSRNIADVNLVIGEGSKANFIDNLELIDFCGTVKVTVNKTMKLAFSAKNPNDKKEHRKELFVHAGETYFALDLSENENREIIVKSERELNELPPILQNSIRAQFGI